LTEQMNHLGSYEA